MVSRFDGRRAPYPPSTSPERPGVPNELALFASGSDNRRRPASRDVVADDSRCCSPIVVLRLRFKVAVLQLRALSAYWRSRWFFDGVLAHLLRVPINDRRRRTATGQNRWSVEGSAWPDSRQCRAAGCRYGSCAARRCRMNEARQRRRSGVNGGLRRDSCRCRRGQNAGSVVAVVTGQQSSPTAVGSASRKHKWLVPRRKRLFAHIRLRHGVAAQHDLTRFAMLVRRW